MIFQYKFSLTIFLMQKALRFETLYSDLYSFSYYSWLFNVQEQMFGILLL